MRADLGCLADDHARAVVDEKMAPDLRSGMNVDPGAAVRPFGHHARDERQIGQIEQWAMRWIAIASSQG